MLFEAGRQLAGLLEDLLASDGASAGVEVAAETPAGRAFRKLVPADAGLFVREQFSAECGAVLRNRCHVGDPARIAALPVAVGTVLIRTVRTRVA